jgi:hypothetical protein
VGAARTDAVEVVPEDYSYVFNPYREPIARVEPGQRVKIHTEDAFESRIHTPRRPAEPRARHREVPEPPDGAYTRRGRRAGGHPGRPDGEHRAEAGLRG